MDGPAFRWLEERMGPLRPGRRVLVLCRTRATAALVRRWAARRGGVLGLEAATPAGLAQQVVQPALFGARAEPPPPEAIVPHGTAIGARIAGRPGLSAAARRWVRHLRGARRAGRVLDAPAWLDELAATGWGGDAGDETLLALVDAARARGRALHAGATWDRVVALGFDRDDDVLDPWEPALLDALGATRKAPPPEHAGRLEAVRVPDVVAEARVAASIALADPDGTLVLVSETTTARRVRDALARNGVACAWRDSEALSVHALAGTVRRCAAWFEEGPDPPVEVADLASVLGRTSLARLHPAADAALRDLLASRGLPPPQPFGRRGLVRVLDRARILGGPLSLWLRRLATLADEGLEHAPAVRVRLLILKACLEARAVEDVLADDAGRALTFDADDFEDAIAELLGEERTATLPDGRTLGAVKRFLVECRVPIGDDPVARAIFAALRDRAAWPAGAAHVHQALSGALDPGVLSDGVDVLLADDWDGRPCRTLLVLDAHDHGLGRHGAPDPLLADAAIARLGAIPPGRVVDERLAQVRRAAGLAGRVIAVVTERDAGGRDVVPPVLLDLAIGPAAAGSYGLDLGLAELDATRALEAVAGGPPEVPDHPDAAVRHLAIQAAAEWYRDGRGPRVAPPAAPADRALPLADHLARDRPIAPDWVLPYLGHAEGVPEARLGPGPWSVSRFLGPLAHCPWQAFARAVLGLDEERTLSEDLDPREVGTVVHEALEEASGALAWRRIATDDEAQAAVAALRTATTDRFAALVTKVGALTPARVASVEGHRDRWNTHWAAYVRSRRKGPHLDWPRPYDRHPDVLAAEAHTCRAMPAAAELPAWKVRAWILRNARSGGADRAVSARALLEIDDRSSLPPACEADVVAVLDHPLLRRAGHAVEEGSRNRWLWLDKVERHAVASEIPFGLPDARPAPVAGLDDAPALSLPLAALRLGSADLDLRGAIDRAEWVTTRAGHGVGIVDYKTGRAVTQGWEFRRDQLTLRDPQLLVYAMVLARAVRQQQLPEPLRLPSAVVAHDRVRHTTQEGGAPEAPDTWLPIEPGLLRWAAQKLGAQVDDARAGRWTLRPRADTCPRLTAYGHDHCPLAPACRLRALPEEAG